MGGVVAVKRLGDGGGNQEHPVQVVSVLSQGFAGDEALGDGLAVFVPFEVGIQVYAFAAAVVHSAEDVGVLGNFLAILPLAVQEEILVRKISLAFQPVFQLLKHLLRRALAGVFQLIGIVRREFPAVKFDDFHFSKLLSFYFGG